MNSVGGFREGEINGKPFHIFTTSSSFSSGEATIDSGGDDFPPPFQPLFICQSFRKGSQWYSRRSDDPNHNEFVPVDVYPQFFDKRSGDQQFQYSIGSNIHDNPCKLPLVPLFWCNNKETAYHEFRCGLCRSEKLGTNYYFCVTCGEKFHKECIESPLEIKHPSYPFLSLKLYYASDNPLNFFSLCCLCCQTRIPEILYYCPTYKLILHPVCAMKPIPIFIDHPKRHPHSLTFFPKQNSLACNVCGLVKEHFPTYVCARCVFVVHQDCVYHPYVIRISRHNHRISFTYSLPCGKWSCGVCRQNVNNTYVAYSCNMCDDYFVHTKCALREDLWDGKELEGIPEEPEIVVEPFERISDGIILHFSHSHHLKFQMSKIYDEDKFCQACVLPIYEGGYYACMDECNFIIHEACANAPRRKHHPLHAHPLMLDIVTNEYNGAGRFCCQACLRHSCGFVYEDSNHTWGFELDLRCASVSEPFKYEGHEHPLFLALNPEEANSAICQICQEDSVDGVSPPSKLNCIECEYIICFKCATLPYKVRYKHDKHFLTFQKKEEPSDHPGWCDICESKIEYSRKGGYYSCDDYCSTTVHVDCLLGKHPYMKPGKVIDSRCHIRRNSAMTRPFCHGCNHRCTDNVVFKSGNRTFCSTKCFWKSCS